MTQTVNIRDLPRGTNPPFSLNLSVPDGSPLSLVGHTIIFVMRGVRWDASNTDADALIRVRAHFWHIDEPAELPLITNPQMGDIVWIDSIDPADPTAPPDAQMFDGINWNSVSMAENDILNGIYTIRFKREDTMIDVGQYFYSIDLVFPHGEVTKLMRGSIRITDNTVNEI